MRDTCTRRWLSLVALVVLSVAGLAATPPAQAVGVDVYEVDEDGNKTTSIDPFPIGTMNPTMVCCCAEANDGGVGYGARACYLPIP